MKIGINLPNSGPFALAENIGRVAVECEGLGYDSLWVHDHLHRRMEDAEVHHVAGSPAAWERWEGPLVPNMYESVTTLFYVAGLTKNIELGTSVVVLPLRHPVWLAKYIACLDQFSGGRVIFGIGSGGGYFLLQELDAFGRPELFEPRGRLVDEWIAIMRGIWSEPEFSYEGEFLQIKNAVVYPKPAQDHIPMIYGGNNVPRVRRRIARALDGWLPMFHTPEELRAGREALLEEAEAVGRAASDFQIVTQHWLSIGRDAEAAKRREWSTRATLFDNLLPRAGSEHEGKFWADKWAEKSDISLAGDPDSIGELVLEYRAAGADHMVLNVIADDFGHMLEAIQMFKEEVWDRLPAAAAAS